MPDDIVTEEVAEQSSETATDNAEDQVTDESIAFSSDDDDDDDDVLEIGLENQEPEKKEEKADNTQDGETEDDEAGKQEISEEETDETDDDDEDIKRGQELIEAQKAADVAKQEKEQQEAETKKTEETGEGKYDFQKESFDTKTLGIIQSVIPKNLLPSEPIKLEDGTELDFGAIDKDYPEMRVYVAAIANNLMRQMISNMGIMTGDQFQESMKGRTEQADHDRFVRTVRHPQYGVPKAEEIAASDAFKEWLPNQKDEIKALFKSSNPFDHIRGLKRFLNQDVLDKAKTEAEKKDEKRKKAKDEFDKIHKTTARGKAGKPKTKVEDNPEDEKEAFESKDDDDDLYF